MRPEFLETGYLRGFDGGDLRLGVFEEAAGHVIEGVLWDSVGGAYPIQGGVPRLVRGPLPEEQRRFLAQHGVTPPPDDAPSDASPSGQERTSASFSDKWRRFQDYGTTAEHQEFLFDWQCAKLGLPDVDALKQFYRGHERILEVGPGSGFNSRFMAEQTDGAVVAVDISEAAFTTFNNTSELPNCHVVQADLTDLPLADETFDLIFADGVLHHTPDTRASLRALCPKLKPGGQMFFYVYRKMGAARQFCDEYLRGLFSQLEPEACYGACEGFTELGRELGKLGASVTLTRGIPELGIAPGTHDVQRLLYYHFLKCFWNDAFDFETNNMVNYDWYHPHYAWQQTEDEVKSWLEELGVSEYAFNPSNPNGISVLFTK